MNIKYSVCETFFADEVPRGGAEIIVEFPRFVVGHPSQVSAVLVVLPVVRLVGRPGEEVLTSKTKTCCFKSSFTVVLRLFPS